jgi:hypothetical protein
MMMMAGLVQLQLAQLFYVGAADAEDSSRAHRERVRDPHPDILVRADRLVGASVDLRDFALQPALQMLHGRDPEAIILRAE